MTNAMQQAITVTRNMRGELEACAIVELPGMAPRALHVSTYAQRGGIVSRFTVQKRDGAFWQWDIFGDYNEKTQHPGKRGTTKALAEFQAQALATVPGRLEAIAAHYAKKAAAH
jgi:hypothetical protein